MESQSEVLVVPHAARRLAVAIVSAIESAVDYRTLEHWGSAARPSASGSAISTWCRTAGIEPHDARDLSRLIRVVRLAEGNGWRPWDMLDIVDARTLARLLTRAGLRDDQGDSYCFTVPELLRQQRLITDARIVDEVRRQMASLQAVAGRSRSRTFCDKSD